LVLIGVRWLCVDTGNDLPCEQGDGRALEIGRATPGERRAQVDAPDAVPVAQLRNSMRHSIGPADKHAFVEETVDDEVTLADDLMWLGLNPAMFQAFNEGRDDRSRQFVCLGVGFGDEKEPLGWGIPAVAAVLSIEVKAAMH
jgi:hypothetical protein